MQMASEELDCIIEYRNKFSLWSGYFIILYLRNYGLDLPALKCLVLWSYVVFDAIMLYVVIPFWIWIEKSPDQSEKSSNFSATARCITIRVKVGLCIALIVMVFRENDFSEWRNSIGFRENDLSEWRNRILLFIVLLIISYEGFLKITGFFREQNKKCDPNQILMDLPTILSMKPPIFYWNAVTLLIPSTISVLIWITGFIMIAGSVGDMLCLKLFWTVFSMLFVDFIAEVIHRYDIEKESLYDTIPQFLPKRRYIANVIRGSVQGLLCYSLIVQISGNPNYLDVKVHHDYWVDGCGAQCQDRSRRMLMKMAVLSGIQATVAFAIPLCSFLPCIFTGETETEEKKNLSPSQC